PRGPQRGRAGQGLHGGREPGPEHVRHRAVRLPLDHPAGHHRVLGGRAGGAVRHPDHLGPRPDRHPLRRQPAEGHRGSRGHPAAHPAGRRAAHPGPGRGLDRVHPPADPARAGSRHRGAAGLQRVGRGHGALRPGGGDVPGPDPGRGGPGHAAGGRWFADDGRHRDGGGMSGPAEPPPDPSGEVSEPDSPRPAGTAPPAGSDPASADGGSASGPGEGGSASGSAEGEPASGETAGGSAAGPAPGTGGADPRRVGDPPFVVLFLRTLWSANPVTVTVLAILLALLVGAILIVVADPSIRAMYGYFFARPSDALGASWDRVSEAYYHLFRGAVVDPRVVVQVVDGELPVWRAFGPISETLSYATPLVFTGLAFALA